MIADNEDEKDPIGRGKAMMQGRKDTAGMKA